MRASELTLRGGATWGPCGDRRASRCPRGACVIDPVLDVLGDEAQRPLFPTDPDRRDATCLGGVVEPGARDAELRGEFGGLQEARRQVLRVCAHLPIDLQPGRPAKNFFHEHPNGCSTDARASSLCSRCCCIGVSCRLRSLTGGPVATARWEDVGMRSCAGLRAPVRPRQVGRSDVLRRARRQAGACISRRLRRAPARQSLTAPNMTYGISEI